MSPGLEAEHLSIRLQSLPVAALFVLPVRPTSPPYSILKTPYRPNPPALSILLCFLGGVCI